MEQKERKKVILHEVTAQQILTLIKQNNLQQGDRLPTERDLAKQLGISRTSLRETLQTLEANGIVVKKHGSGVYVDVVDELTILPGDDSGNPDPKDVLLMLKNLVQARMMIETFCIAEVGKNITQEQLDIIYGHEDAEYMRLSGSSKPGPAPGLDFEHCIACFLPNPVIINIHKRLNSSWKSYMATINAVALSPLKRHKDHMAIIHALESQNVNKVEKAVYQHHFQTMQALDILIARLECGQSDMLIL